MTRQGASFSITSSIRARRTNKNYKLPGYNARSGAFPDRIHFVFPLPALRRFHERAQLAGVPMPRKAVCLDDTAKFAIQRPVSQPEKRRALRLEDVYARILALQRRYIHLKTGG